MAVQSWQSSFMLLPGTQASKFLHLYTLWWLLDTELSVVCLFHREGTCKKKVPCSKVTSQKRPWQWRRLLTGQVSVTGPHGTARWSGNSAFITVAMHRNYNWSIITKESENGYWGNSSLWQNQSVSPFII